MLRSLVRSAASLGARRNTQAAARSVRQLSATAGGGCGAPECGTGVCAGSAAVASSSKLGAAASAYPKSAASKNLSSAAGALRPATVQAVTSAPSASAIFGSSSPSAQASLAHVSSLLNSREQGKTLPAAFYLDESMYAAELALLWNRGWLFAGYTNQLPKAGNYFTYEIGDESLIIIRSEDGGSSGGASDGASDGGKIQAFHNSCRHRGSRIVTATQDTQHTHRLVCPYHQWSYGRDGSLLHARDMGASFSKEDNALLEVHLEEVEGLIFICLTPKSQKPMWDFAPARALMSPQLKPHNLARGSKIAYSANYTINSNWKLVYENNRECLHCAGSHPEYVKSNYDLHLTYNQKPDGTYERALDPSYPGKDKVLAYIESRSRDWESMGIACSPDSSFPGDGWYRASRMPLREGWVTESLDGQPVSTIMGNLPMRDMGSFRIHTLPNYWLHLSGDHGVSSRLTPTGPFTTQARVDWLVAADAVEGVDYHLEKMLPFWSVTSDQDWHLCEINMQGIRSSSYRPGTLSERKEAGLDRFLGWYIDAMKKGVKQAQQTAAANK